MYISVFFSAFLLLGSTAIANTKPLDYAGAERYVTAWASSVNVLSTLLDKNPDEFHGTLGSLDFSYSEEDKLLHVWVFVMPGAGPFVTKREEVKVTLDQIARQHPEETAGGVFDIRTLDWNRQVSTKLEPCLWLRIDVADDTIPPDKMMVRFKDLSRTGFIWNRQKMLEVLRDYWKKHPEAAK